MSAGGGNHAGAPVTEFLVPPSRDREAMARLGLGGSAAVGGFQFAGAMAIDLATIRRLSEAKTIADETRVCLDQLRGAFALGGKTLGDVVKLTAYVSDAGHRDEMWDVLREAFPPQSRPKCVTLVAGIAGDCRVELEAVAHRADASAWPRPSDRGPLRPGGDGPAAGAIVGGFVITAATALDPATMRRVPEADSIEGELAVVLRRLEATLAEDGLTLRDLAKVTAWVSEEEHRLAFAYAYRDLLAPGPYPSRALFRIGLPGDCRIQVDAIAARRPAGDQPPPARDAAAFLSAGGHAESGFAAGARVGGVVWAEASAVDADGRRDRRAVTVGDETRCAVERLRATLRDAGGDLADLAKVNCYLAAEEHREEFSRAFAEACAPNALPVTVVQVGGVAGEARVLLDAVAATR